MADDVRSHIEHCLDSGAGDRLRRYFSPNAYTGSHFEHLAGGGDRPQTANRFSADDIVAVSMLGVRVHPTAALIILDDRSDEFAALLADIPNGIDLWDVPPEVIGPDSYADTLWHGLDDISEIGWVIAGKLLARKRPRLIPIYDRIVKAAVHTPANWWVDLHAALQDEGLRQLLEQLHTESGVAQDISLLRILDIAIWMTSEDPATS